MKFYAILKMKQEADELLELAQFANTVGNYELSQEIFDDYKDLLDEIAQEEMYYPKKVLKLKLPNN